MHMIRLQDSEESGYVVQDGVTTTKYLETFNMMVDTTVQNQNIILITECYHL